jgi:hypothetical protein
MLEVNTVTGVHEHDVPLVEQDDCVGYPVDGCTVLNDVAVEIFISSACPPFSGPG